MSASAIPLFQATKKKAVQDPAQMRMVGLHEHKKPREPRDPLDFDPTPPDATQAFLSAEAGYMRAHGNLIWENAVGAGHMAKVFRANGFDVVGTDLVDRGWAGVALKSFYDFDHPLAPINVTNPPFCEISSRASGRWMWHTLSLGMPYIGLLLGSEWCAARINTMDRLFQEHPPSIEYRCCWKIDFRGQGQAPQRNSFFVWDQNRPALGPNEWRCVRLFRDRDVRQGQLL